MKGRIVKLEIWVLDHLEKYLNKAAGKIRDMNHAVKRRAGLLEIPIPEIDPDDDDPDWSFF